MDDQTPQSPPPTQPISPPGKPTVKQQIDDDLIKQEIDVTVQDQVVEPNLAKQKPPKDQPSPQTPPSDSHPSK